MEAQAPGTSERDCIRRWGLSSSDGAKIRPLGWAWPHMTVSSERGDRRRTLGRRRPHAQGRGLGRSWIPVSGPGGTGKAGAVAAARSAVLCFGRPDTDASAWHRLQRISLLGGNPPSTPVGCGRLARHPHNEGLWSHCGGVGGGNRPLTFLRGASLWGQAGEAGGLGEAESSPPVLPAQLCRRSPPTAGLTHSPPEVHVITSGSPALC